MVVWVPVVAAVLVKPHGFTINLSLGVVTSTPAPLYGFPLGLWTLFGEQQLHASLHLIVRSLFPHGLH